MITKLLFNKLKSFLLLFVNIFRKALCCFRRKRRNSFDSVPLTHIGVISNEAPRVEQENWTDWDDTPKPKTVQDHIELYRKQVVKQEAEPEENMDFFEDMSPKITAQQKIFVGNDSSTSNKGNLSRLNFSGDSEGMILDSELGEWEETGGWETEGLDHAAQEALREKKRLERERKYWEQQQKRLDKNTRLGAKVNV